MTTDIVTAKSWIHQKLSQQKISLAMPKIFCLKALIVTGIYGWGK
jgi:hypothetical protein